MGKQRSHGARVEGHPDGETESGEEKKDGRQPPSGSGKFGPALKRMLSCEDKVASGAENQRPFQEADDKESAKQGVAKEGAASRREDQLAGPDGEGGDDRARAEDHDPGTRATERRGGKARFHVLVSRFQGCSKRMSGRRNGVASDGESARPGVPPDIGTAALFAAVSLAGPSMGEAFPWPPCRRREKGRKGSNGTRRQRASFIPPC